MKHSGWVAIRSALTGCFTANIEIFSCHLACQDVRPAFIAIRNPDPLRIRLRLD